MNNTKISTQFLTWTHENFNSNFHVVATLHCLRSGLQHHK